LYPPTKSTKNTVAEAETEVVMEMLENHLMVVEVMVTEMELTKVITQGKDAYGGVARGGGGHGGGSFMVMVLTKVAAEKLMKMVMEVVVTEDVDIVYNYA
ncbi:unnamed protein product, partial [Brassica oleracea var. botrytis]